MRKLAVAAIVCALAPAGAQAADLGGYYGGDEPRGYSYEEPRYPDRYDEPRFTPPPPPTYGYRAPPPVAGPYAYRPAPGYVEPDTWRYDRSGCAGKDAIRDRLVSAGWRDFHDPVVEGPFANLKARRANGDVYMLRVSRCSGEVVHTQFIRPGRTFGPYAYGEDYRPRWRRPFY
jgi:hypothetical protein